MTTEQPRPQSSQPSPRSQPAPARKRSPIERAIVWGLILVLLIVGGLEARARFGYKGTLDALEGDDVKLGKLSTLRDSIKFWPSEEKMDIHGRPVLILEWFSLLNVYRIALLVDSTQTDDPSVLTFQTAGEEDGILAKIGTPPPVASEGPDSDGMPSMGGGPAGQEAASSGPPPGMTPGGPGGPGGSGGGRQFPTFEERDENGDGKLTDAELSERMKENLAEIDADQDGAVSKEEFDAMVARRPSRGGGGGAGAGGPGAGRPGAEGRPQRPSAADEAPAGAAETGDDPAPAASDPEPPADPDPDPAAESNP